MRIFHKTALLIQTNFFMSLGLMIVLLMALFNVREDSLAS